MGIKQFLWSFLPDQCDVRGCCRKGMRGNENIIFPWPERYESIGIIMCDYCHSKYMDGTTLLVNGLMPMVHEQGELSEDQG